MAAAQFTRRFFAEALKSLTRTKAFSSITVADICDAVDVNRKTFYYHFKDKYDLLAYVFDSECGDELEHSDIQDFWEFYGRLARYLYAKRGFYKKIFAGKDHSYLEKILNGFLLRNFERYLRPGLFEDDHEEKEKCLMFLCTTFVASLKEWITFHPDISTAEYLELSRFDKVMSR